MNFVVKYRRAFVAATSMFAGAAIFFSVSATTAATESIVGQGPAPERTVANETLIHADINNVNWADKADIGDAWISRIPGATAGSETLNIDLQVQGTVTATRVCLSQSPITIAVPHLQCPNFYEGALPGAGNEFSISVPAGLTGKPIYAQIGIGNGPDITAWATLHMVYGNVYGNTLIPTLGYTGPRDICPANELGRIVNQGTYANGTLIRDITAPFPANAEVTVKFTVAPGCSNQEATLNHFFTKSLTINDATLATQVLHSSDTGMFSQDADVQNYALHSLTVQLVDDCMYQTDFSRGHQTSATDANYGINLMDARLGGTKDCTELKPTTTTTEKITTTTTCPPKVTTTTKEMTTTTNKPHPPKVTTTTVKPTTTTKPHVLPTTIVKPTTTTTKPVTTTTKKPATTTTTEVLTTTTKKPLKPTTTTTEEPTTTTTEPPTTTTTVQVLPEVVTTTTTAPPIVLGETQTATESLAKTGAESFGLMLFGFGAVSSGFGLRRAVRNRKSS